MFKTREVIYQPEQDDDFMYPQSNIRETEHTHPTKDAFLGGDKDKTIVITEEAYRDMVDGGSGVTKTMSTGAFVYDDAKGHGVPLGDLDENNPFHVPESGENSNYKHPDTYIVLRGMYMRDSEAKPGDKVIDFYTNRSYDPYWGDESTFPHTVTWGDLSYKENDDFYPEASFMQQRYGTNPGWEKSDRSLCVDNMDGGSSGGGGGYYPGGGNSGGKSYSLPLIYSSGTINNDTETTPGSEVSGGVIVNASYQKKQATPVIPGEHSDVVKDSGPGKVSDTASSGKLTVTLDDRFFVKTDSADIYVPPKDSDLAVCEIEPASTEETPDPTPDENVDVPIRTPDVTNKPPAPDTTVRIDTKTVVEQSGTPGGDTTNNTTTNVDTPGAGDNNVTHSTQVVEGDTYNSHSTGGDGEDTPGPKVNTGGKTSQSLWGKIKDVLVG